MHKKYRGHVPLQTYLHQIKNQFFLFIYFVFPALIVNPNNFEINRLFRLVVSGAFLLPYSASLLSFSSFQSHFQETLSTVDTLLKWTPCFGHVSVTLDSFPCSCTLLVQFQQATNCSKSTVNIRKRCEICSKLIIKKPKRRN